MRELGRYVLGLVNANQQTYSIYMEESELAIPEVVVMCLFFAVYDCSTQKVCFCLLDPEHQTYEDVAWFQMPRQETDVAARLQAYIASNARALQ